MRCSWVLVLGTWLLLHLPANAAAKPHVISFGKTTTVKWLVGLDEEKAVDLKVRPLFVDTRVKEYTTGPARDITDRLFVVRRVFRLNDALPEDPATPARWQWQRGGWLLVDRMTGRVTPVNLPEFDALYSAASWYRDYVAYCGISDDGRKAFALVAQVGRRKPLLKKQLGSIELNGMPDFACRAPQWQRQPARVTFPGQGGERTTFSIRGHVIDLVNDQEEEAEATE